MNHKTKKRIQEFTFDPSGTYHVPVFVIVPYPGLSHVFYKMGWYEP